MLIEEAAERLYERMLNEFKPESFTIGHNKLDCIHVYLHKNINFSMDSWHGFTVIVLNIGKISAL